MGVGRRPVFYDLGRRVDLLLHVAGPRSHPFFYIPRHSAWTFLELSGPEHMVIKKSITAQPRFFENPEQRDYGF